MRLPDEIAGEAAPDHGAGDDLDRIIGRLVDGQLYGVLCTQGEGQPSGSLVAFAMTPDLDSAVFATQKATRKYRSSQSAPTWRSSSTTDRRFPVSSWRSKP